MVAGLSVFARISGVSWSQLEIAVPLNATILSPTWNPASLAGDTLSVSTHLRSVDACEAGITQSVTVATVVCATLAPYSMNRPPNSTNAITTLTSGPDAITISFFHHTFW